LAGSACGICGTSRLKNAPGSIPGAPTRNSADIDEAIAIVNRLLNEQLAREHEAEHERFQARLGELRSEQVEALKVCAERFSELFDGWREFAATQQALQSAWWLSPGREGVRSGHLLDPTPVTFEALLGVLYRAALRREDIGYQVLEGVSHLVPDLGRDTPLELGGQAVQPLGRF
jgi:hypothetical protein